MITTRVLVSCLLLLFLPAWAGAGAVPGERLARLAGDGAVMAVGADGEVFASHRPDKALVPASILKIVTAAAALEVLGPGHRFETVFRRTPEGDLAVSGRGDPHLVSEEVARIAGALRSKGLERVRHLLLDNRCFQPGLVLHGTNRSLNPYDAYNGALCVNFNTIFVRVDDRGRVRSAEPQTPLTELARRAALESGERGRVRINLAESPEQCLLYAGELLAAFLRKEGIEVKGEVRRYQEDPEAFPRLYVHRSSWSLEELLEKMFRFSNNFMANQIFLAVGASRYGPPATPEKARRAVDRFLTSVGVEGLHVEEGSGLSRRTRITASQMIRVLERFRPHRRLLDCGQGACTKTGTLHDVKSLAGYLAPDSGNPVSFVILLNGKEHGYGSRKRIFSLLRDRFAPSRSE